MKKPVLGISILILLLLCVYPFAILLVKVLFSGPNESFTLKSFEQIIQSPTTLRAITNTLKVSLSVSALSALIGVPLAWLLSRTNFPAQRKFAISKKDKSRANAQRVADWFFSQDGQEAMTRSFMYSVLPNFPAPKGAKEFKEVLKVAPKWTPELLKEIMEKREEIKEEFTQIMFQ